MEGLRDVRHTRSGRSVVPVLAWWRNQHKLLDDQGNFLAIAEGSVDFTPATQPFTDECKVLADHKMAPADRAHGYSRKSRVPQRKPTARVLAFDFDEEDIEQEAAQRQRGRGEEREGEGCGGPDLPCELMLHVMSYLKWTDLCMASMVCRAWRSMASDDSLWRSLYERCAWKTPAPPASDDPTAVETWKEMYLSRKRQRPMIYSKRLRLDTSSGGSSSSSLGDIPHLALQVSVNVHLHAPSSASATSSASFPSYILAPSALAPTSAIAAKALSAAAKLFEPPSPSPLSPFALALANPRKAHDPNGKSSSRRKRKLQFEGGEKGAGASSSSSSTTAGGLSEYLRKQKEYFDRLDKLEITEA